MQSKLPFDNSYARLPDRFFTKLDPTPVDKPALIALNRELANELGLSADFLSSPEGIATLSGNKVLEGSEPLAMAYAGQQFGSWVPQLGDGRAVLLGEILDKENRRWDIQLKGSGPTPYSRMGDGRAWLGPVLREYIVSEAMHALGVPTTRALAAVSTGEDVVREQVLPGAVLTRVSKSHVRVGTFQYFIARKDIDGLKTLADYVVDRLYPELTEADNPYSALLEKVVDRQAYLVASWMNLGFIHGVMNTDNVSIAGETIDYGPCAFMDEFHADKVFSSIDQFGRYAYSNQPKIAHWNLVQFAQAILPLLHKDEKQQIETAQTAIDEFPERFKNYHQAGFNAKLGLSQSQPGDEDLQKDLLAALQKYKLDFTSTFRSFSETDAQELAKKFRDYSDFLDWIEKWRQRSSQESRFEDRQELMLKSNPAFIPRNHRVEEVIRNALDGNFQPFERLTKVLETPFENQPEHADLMDPPEPDEIVQNTFCGT